MTAQQLSLAQSNLKMALWQADADSMSSSELYAWLIDSGLPHEVTIRLHELISYTKTVGSKVIAVGKIILIKIIEFIKEHRNLVIGAGIGAAVAAAVSGLITSVPILGSVLAPVAAALGIVITAAGAIAGHRLDKRDRGQQGSGGVIGLAEDIIEIAKEFFQLVIDVFNTVFRHVITV